jgi:prepilin-type processing-associated H-X9-DG protein
MIAYIRCWPIAAGRLQRLMSAFRGKANMAFCDANVC